VLIRSNSNSDASNFNFLVTSVTDEGNHFHINGTYVSGSAFTNNEVVTFDFYMTGDLGATGPAPSGTGFVKVVSGVLQTPSASIAQDDVTNLTSDLALKAPLISPSFTTPSLGEAVMNGSIIPAVDSSVTLGDDDHFLASIRANDLFIGGLQVGINNGGVLMGQIRLFSGSSTSSTILRSLAETDDIYINFPNAGGDVALTNSPLSVFAATTSNQLAGVISDETGTGSLVFGTSPTIDAPTVSGAAQFTSTTRPTSAGTGTPAATSLMTRLDSETAELFALSTVRRSEAGTYTANGGSSGTSNGRDQLSTGLLANARPLVVRYASLFGSPTISGATTVKIRPIRIATQANLFHLSNNANGKHVFAFGANTGAFPAAEADILTARGFGWEIFRNGANTQTVIGLFAHDGTTYVRTDGSGGRSSPVDTLLGSGATNGQANIIIGIDAAGLVSLWASFTTTAVTTPLARPSSTPILTLAGGPTSGSTGSSGFPAWASLNHSTIVPTESIAMHIIDRLIVID
jgi:hypothetical protein